jgi:pimeloyl-ACP methyl ester carboxylesterase
MNCASAKNERLLIFDENNRQHAKAEGRIIIAKRLVFHVGGYDPITPPVSARRRFVRELARFAGTWSVEASIGALQETPDQAKWNVVTRGPNWCVESDYRLIRWDDVIEEFSGQPIWRRIPLGINALIDFILAGALRGYLRTNWHYAVFFLYPFVMFGFFIAAACVAGAYAFHGSDSILLAAAVCLFVLSALLLGPWRWLLLDTLFDDWIFACDYVRSGNSSIEKRFDNIAREIVAAARNSGADEILVIGHSLGAVLAVDLLDRALKLNRALGAAGTPITFLSIGSSILKIGLHGAASRFRAAVEQVGRAPGIFWGDCQARIDIMNFYNIDPMAEMSLPSKYGPIIRLVEFGRMLQHDVYRRIRLKFYRLHCQFISGNDKRASYDYFMLVCGPISARYQILAPDGALSLVGEDGSLNADIAGHRASVSSERTPQPYRL